MQDGRPRICAEIDLGKIKKNYRCTMSHLGECADAIAVIKSNAYGHGDTEVARALRECGVRRFAVSNIDEALRLRRAGFSRSECELLILGYTPPDMLSELCDHGLTQALISEEYACELAARMKKRHIGRMKTHLAIDSGMRRIGLDAEDTDRITALAKRYRHILGIEAVFTHLCTADGQDASDIEYTRLQLKRFNKVMSAVYPLGITDAHALNSAGILWHAGGVEVSLKSLVRPGIILYGLSPKEGAELPLGISPALTWKTHVAMVKSVRRGECIGYGRAYRAERNMRVATLPLGYADGYPRALSDKGFVMINGKGAPILGRICMNQMMVDAGAVRGVRAGDEVTLIGSDISADTLAQLAGTISYELLSRIPADVPRIYKGI